VSDVFQEIEEEYRQQQMAKFWEKYRGPIIGAAAALVIGVAGYQAWSYWNAQQVEKSSREMEAIGELLRNAGGEKQAAERLSKLGASGAGGYSTLAKLQQAALVAQSGDIKTAIKLYQAVANSESSPLFRDFAIVRAGVFLVEVETYDNVKKTLGPIATGSGPWVTQAKELLAYAAWRAGKADEAKALYEDIEKNESAPAGVKRRSTEMLALIRSGLKFADVKPAQPLLLQPSTGTTPMLLPPLTPPAEQPGSLLGPDPTAPAEPAAPTPTPQ
jgi:hypothetical protein